ncbi:MAG: response regulator transcription factor [Anaerolineaceae bacterium]
MSELNFSQESIETRIQNKGLDLDSMEMEIPHKRVMIVDDEPDTVEMVKLILTNAGIDVISASSGKAALEKCLRLSPDAILLDIMMPEIDGYETYDRLRKITQTPVIFFTAKAQKEELVKGLQIGADDYITKPYHPAELVARVHNTFRHNNNHTPVNSYFFPNLGLKINVDTREVTVHDQTVPLTSRELALLSILARSSNNWVTHETIGNEIWGQDNEKTRKRIKYLIFLLRRKMEKNPSKPVLIISRDGLGYKLVAD